MGGEEREEKTGGLSAAVAFSGAGVTGKRGNMGKSGEKKRGERSPPGG